MYARYIPPPKGSQASASKPEAKAPSPPPVAAPSPSFSSAAPYARYVPPARPSAARSSYHNNNSYSSTPTPAPRAPPPSKTHLHAAAIPPPESLPPKIVFNYDDDDENDEALPSPSKKRKLDTPEPEASPQPKEKKSKKDKKEKSSDVKEKKSKKEKKEKKEKKSKDKKEVKVADYSSPDEEGNALERTKGKKSKKSKSKAEPFAFGFDEDTIATEVVAEEGKAKESEHDVEIPIRTVADAGDSGLMDVKKVESKKTKNKNKDDDSVPARHKAVLEKAAKSLKEAQQQNNVDAEASDDDDNEAAEPVEAHGLEPLPQPEPVAQDSSKPTYETLPSWMANPIRVAPETKASFTKLGISKEAATKLGTKGYENAFAVQTAVIPLLLPSPDRQGDVVVSAATGSGKTLAYVLPVIRDISQGFITRLRGVIVVPTRELVLQAKEACETCAAVFSGPGKKTVRIAISMGNKQFEQEQSDLVEEEQRYDPMGHQTWLEEHFKKDFETSLFEHESKPLPDHVVDYSSKVDVLICTPGRLVDHINRTRGFTLDYVRWLVVDEADKLLAQTFQDWLPAVMPLLSTTNKPGARDFPDSNKSGVRKVVLSATMTRDLSLLNGLKLFRPKLVTLEGVSGENDSTRHSATEHVLPELLEESAIKIRDPTYKPLYLVDLLNSTRMAPVNSVGQDVEMKDVGDDDTSSGESASDSDSSDTDASSDASDSDSDDDSTSPARQSLSKKASTFRSTVLIFTKSNETAIRLSRLLSLLSPALAPLIGTLTSTTRTSQRRKTLRAFTSHKLRILVASDLVARGIDLANLDHVVNYDLPTSVASYVHRVGRTARAGRKGRAWTLFTKTEAGWFWTAVAGKGESRSAGAAGAGLVKRKGKVDEVKIDDRWAEGRVEEFERALETLGKEASEMRRKR